LVSSTASSYELRVLFTALHVVQVLQRSLPPCAPLSDLSNGLGAPHRLELRSPRCIARHPGPSVLPTVLRTVIRPLKRSWYPLPP
jgi:hypothetical protein